MKKRYFYFNILAIFILLAVACIYNYKLDAYGIFKDDFSNQVLEVNKNYIKVKYILDNPEKYDSFLFGSSRVGALENELIPNGNYYNMGYSQGLPLEWLNNIKTLLANDVEIKNIFLALDEFSFTVNPKDHLREPLRIPYEDMNSYKIFRTYLFRDPFDLYNTETIKGKKAGILDGANFDFQGTGRGYNDFIEEQQSIKNLSFEELNNPIYDKPITFNNTNRLEETVGEIKEIIDLCKANNIKLHVIFNPIHSTNYNNIDTKLLQKSIEEVNKLTDLWDFTQQGYIAKDNSLWLETSHYKLTVGRMILGKVFDVDLQVKCPSYFGVFKPKTQ